MIDGMTPEELQELAIDCGVPLDAFETAKAQGDGGDKT